MDKKVQTRNSFKLEKLHEFARNGGIGTCVATQDTLANTQADLMFYTGEVITILKHIKDDIYLGYCEGVIGKFNGKDVSFNNDQLKTQHSEKSDGRFVSGSPAEVRDKLRGNFHTGHFLNPSDAEHAVQMRSRSSSVSSVELDSEKNTLSSSPVLAPTINITPSSAYDDVSITSSFPTLSKDSRNLHNKDFQNSSPSFNSNPDKSQTSQRETPQLSNDQLTPSNRAQNDSPLLLNSRPAISPHGQNVSPSSKNQIRKMSFPFPSQTPLNQSINAKRNNSAPPLVNNDDVDQKSSPHNSEKNVMRSGQPPISGDRIRSMINIGVQPYPNAGNFVDSPTSSPNSSPRASRNLSENQIPNPYQYNGRPRPSNLTSGPRQVHSRNRSASNVVPFSVKPFQHEVNGRQRSASSATSTKPDTYSNHPLAPVRTLGQSLLSPVRPEFQMIVPPQRTSSMGLPNESPSVNPRLQLKINDRFSPSTTPSPSPILPLKVNLSPTSASRVPQIIIENEDNFSRSNRAVSQSPVSPRVNVSDDQEGSLPSVPILTIEAADDSGGNDSDDLSSEDEDEEHVKSIDETPSKKDKVIAVDEYGFVYDVDEKEIPEGADSIQRIVKAPGSSERNSRTIRLYRERETKWVQFLGNMDPAVARESKKIKKLVRLGIPESVRGKSWQFMAGVHKYRKTGIYEQLCKRERLPIYDVIEGDIHRCYPDHIQFREETGFGQDDLHSILKAYAHYNKAVGYCQGMGRLVGMMLMQMPAEDTFWLLVATIEEYMVGYFTPTLSQVRIDSLVFEQLLFEHDPKLAQHLADNDVYPLTYMTRWFMTIFTMTLPWASVLRVWDVFYFEGVKFFHRIGLAILDCTRDHILKSCPSSSEILEFLLHIPHELLTPDLLLEAAFKIKLKPSTIERMKAIAIEIENNNSSGADAQNQIRSIVKDREAIKVIMKKAKNADKLKIDGIEFKMVNENNN